jgi:hypothetical protein
VFGQEPCAPQSGVEVLKLNLKLLRGRRRVLPHLIQSVLGRFPTPSIHTSLVEGSNASEHCDEGSYSRDDNTPGRKLIGSLDSVYLTLFEGVFGCIICLASLPFLLRFLLLRSDRAMKKGNVSWEPVVGLMIWIIIAQGFGILTLRGLKVWGYETRISRRPGSQRAIREASRSFFSRTEVYRLTDSA